MEAIIQKLHNHCKLTDVECFNLIQHISKLLNSAESVKKQDGRNALILLLDNWGNLSETYQNIIFDLVEAAGFYPYLEKIKTQFLDTDAEIRFAYHKSHHIKDRYFHSKQKEIDVLIKDHRNVIVSAPTSFGKSLLIEEIIASKEYKNIVIIQPTLALLDETRRKLKAYSETYKVIVKTTQPYLEDKGNVFLLTAERVLEYPDMPAIDLLILDEFYKLSNQRNDNRSSVLNTAFVRIMKNPHCRFYMLGPNIDAISEGFVEKYEAVFYKTNFSMVLTEEENLYDSVQTKRGNKIAEEDIFKVLDDLEQQTLIYCSSPATARKLAFGYCNHRIQHEAKQIDDLPLVQWIADNLSYKWSLSKCLRHGIAIHDGSMPKHITSSTIQYFNQNKIRFLFCTNTIIEGVNTSAKNVIYYDDKIGTKDVDYFDYSNIRGRAGRLMEHYVGKIINLKKPPEVEAMKIDFPFFEQNPISTEILINLDEMNIRDINDNVKRFENFKEKDPELQEILKRNSVSVDGQLNILKILMQDLEISSKKKLIIWNEIDKNLYKRLTYIFELCWENLSTKEERKSFGSKKWVINKIVGSYFGNSISEMINKEIEYKGKELAKKKEIKDKELKEVLELYPIEMQTEIDNAIERLFKLQKNWLQYRAPKWINVVDSLQKYATSKYQIDSGDYSYVSEMIENEFIQSPFRILMEYGVPTSAIKKIQDVAKMYALKTDIVTEDDAIDLIKREREYFGRYLSDYENNVLNNVL